jgi:hypothetical protein
VLIFPIKPITNNRICNRLSFWRSQHCYFTIFGDPDSASSPIGSENALNIYLNPKVHGSIPTEGKHSTSEKGGEDREVTVSGPPNVVGPGLL